MVAGVGVNHDELVKHAEVSFSSVPEGMSTTDEQCEYVGGKKKKKESYFSSVVCYTVTLLKACSFRV